MSRQWSGDPQSAIGLRQRASRQTEAQPYQKRPIVDNDENPHAWDVEKPHTSAVKCANPYPRRTALLDEANPKKTKQMRQRRLDRATLTIMVSLLVIVMVGGWWLFSTVANW